MAVWGGGGGAWTLDQKHQPLLRAGAELRGRDLQRATNDMCPHVSPWQGKHRCGHKVRRGCTNPAFLEAQGKCREKTEHFEYKHMGLPVLPAPLHGAPKFSGACGAGQCPHLGVYNGPDLSNILAPESGGGGCWGQGLHLGTPRGPSLSDIVSVTSGQVGEHRR